MRALQTVLYTALLIIGWSLAWSALAHAQEAGRLPFRYVSRPLTLTAATIRLDGQTGLTAIRHGKDIYRFDSGVGIGFTDNFEFGAWLAPLQLAPTFEYLNPLLYGQYRFVSGVVDVGVRVAVNIPVKRGFLLSSGLPVLVHIGHILRLDTGGFVDIHLDDPLYGDSATFRVPGQLAIQVHPRWFLGPDMELAIDVGNGKSRGRLPMGFFAGYTAPGAHGNVLADFRLRMRSEDIGHGADVWSIFAIANIFIFI